MDMERRQNTPGTVSQTSICNSRGVDIVNDVHIGEVDLDSDVESGMLDLHSDVGVDINCNVHKRGPASDIDADTEGLHTDPGLCGNTEGLHTDPGLCGNTEGLQHNTDPGLCGNTESLQHHTDPGLCGSTEGLQHHTDPGLCGNTEGLQHHTDPGLCGNTEGLQHHTDPGLCGSTEGLQHHTDPGLCGNTEGLQHHTDPGLCGNTEGLQHHTDPGLCGSTEGLQHHTDPGLCGNTEGLQHHTDPGLCGNTEGLQHHTGSKLHSGGLRNDTTHGRQRRQQKDVEEILLCNIKSWALKEPIMCESSAKDLLKEKKEGFSKRDKRPQISTHFSSASPSGLRRFQVVKKNVTKSTKDFKNSGKQSGRTLNNVTQSSRDLKNNVTQLAKSVTNNVTQSANDVTEGMREFSKKVAQSANDEGCVAHVQAEVGVGKVDSGSSPGLFGRAGTEHSPAPRQPSGSATRGSATQDSATRDSATRDSATRGSATQSSVTRNSATRGSATWDSATRDSATRDSATRGSATQSSATRDSGTEVVLDGSRFSMLLGLCDVTEDSAPPAAGGGPASPSPSPATDTSGVRKKNFKHLILQMPKARKVPDREVSQLHCHVSPGTAGHPPDDKYPVPAPSKAPALDTRKTKSSMESASGEGSQARAGPGPRAADGRLCGWWAVLCGGLARRLPLVRRLAGWMERNVVEGHEVRNTLMVGLAFQLVFTAHFAIQNLQSSLHEEQYLGVSALSCLYATSIFSAIFSPTFLGLLGTKGTLVTAWVCQILYTLSQFYPTWATLVPASILWGLMVGPTWTAQGLYVSACAYSFSKRSQDSPYTVISRFQGLFFTLFETRQILGNVLSSAILKDGIRNATQAEISFRFCGPQDCPYYENVTDIEEPHPHVLSGMLGVFLALQGAALLLTIFLLAPLPRSQWSAQVPLRQTATSWFRTLVGTKMLFLVPFMIFQAMEQGILLSEYTKSYVSCPVGIHMVGFVMATHGATSAVFVFLFSRLAHYTGRLPLFGLAATLSLVFLLVLYDWTPTANEEALVFLFPVLWGIGEGIWQTQTNAMIAVKFWDQKEPAFANYQTWRAVGFTFIFGFHSVLCVSTKIAVCLAFLVVGMLLYTGVEIFSRWQETVRVPGKKFPDDVGRVATDKEITINIQPPDAADTMSSYSPADNSSSSALTLMTSALQSRISLKDGEEERERATDDGAPRGGKERNPSGDSSRLGLRICWKQSSKKAVTLQEQGLRHETGTREMSSSEGGEDTCSCSSTSSSPRTRDAVPKPAADEELWSAVTGRVWPDATILEHRSGMTSSPAAQPRGSTLSTTFQYGYSSSGEAISQDSVWLEDDKDGELISPRLLVRPACWQAQPFQDEGELRVVWTQHDVFVF